MNTNERNDLSVTGSTPPPVRGPAPQASKGERDRHLARELLSVLRPALEKARASGLVLMAEKLRVSISEAEAVAAEPGASRPAGQDGA